MKLRYKAIQYDFHGGGLIVDTYTGYTLWSIGIFDTLLEAEEYAIARNELESRQLEEIILGEE